MKKNKRLSTYLLSRRLKSGISQKDLANRLGYTSAQFISNWERGLSYPPPRKFRKVAEILDVDVDKLVRLHVADVRDQVKLEVAG